MSVKFCPLSILGIFLQGSLHAQGTILITFDGPPVQPPGTGRVVTNYYEAGMLFTPLPGYSGFIREGAATDPIWVGPGGSPSRAGFASAGGNSFEFSGSGTPGAFLDSNLTTGLIYNDFNSSSQGRYLFQFRNEQVSSLLTL